MEVSDTTLDYDRNTKLPLCTRFGIPETWTLNSSSDTLETHSRPVVGTYRDIMLLERGETLSPKIISGVEHDAGVILP